MRKPFYKTFIGNLVIIGLLCVVLYWLFFASLSLITRHNDVQKVPNLKGLSLGEVSKLLKMKGFELDIDSVYDPKARPLQIMDQQPEQGLTVKSGRTIFLTVNKTQPPMIKMPNLLNLTLRSAVLMLQNNKLLMGDTSYMPDIAAGTILAQKMKGKDIPYNTEIRQGSKIDLVIASGLGNEDVVVPDLIGMTYLQALGVLKASGINYAIAFDDYISDSASAKVYTQLPDGYNEYGQQNMLFVGDILDVRIMQNPVFKKPAPQTNSGQSPAPKPAAQNKPSSAAKPTGNNSRIMPTTTPQRDAPARKPKYTMPQNTRTN